MRKINSVLFLIIVVVGFTSCDSNRVYEQYTEVPDNVWNSNNKIKFEFEIDDTASLHNIYINVRHATFYQYNNLWVFVKSSAPNGKNDIDTVECLLSDKTGKWLGDGMGDIWDLQIPWKMNVRFPVRGKYIVEYEQAMRVDDLPGIMDIGLRVEKVDVK